MQSPPVLCVQETETGVASGLAAHRVLGCPTPVAAGGGDGDAFEHPRGLVGEEHDPVRQHNRFLDVVGHEKYRSAGALPDALDLGAQTSAGIGVQRREGLVHQHDGGINRERAGDSDALALATRQHGRIFVGRIGKPHHAEQLTRPGLTPTGLLATHAKFNPHQDISQRVAPGRESR